MEEDNVATEFENSAGIALQYDVRPVLGKGHGLVATTKILKGTRILAEAPIFKVPYDTSNLEILDKFIAEQLKSLSHSQQAAFLDLYNSHGKRHTSCLGIARTNALTLGSGAREGGFFLTASRINHSCRNNAQNTWNKSIERITVHAVQDIEEGQEITITYLAQAAPYEERQTYLRD